MTTHALPAAVDAASFTAVLRQAEVLSDGRVVAARCRTTTGSRCYGRSRPIWMHGVRLLANIWWNHLERIHLAVDLDCRELRD